MNEFEFEIKPGERLSPETRMPLPEMSYEQELLNTPVPFENRVAFVSDYVKHHSKPETLEHIARAIGVTNTRAQIMIEEVGAPFDQADNTGKYAIFTREVIEEEIQWVNLIEQIGDYLSANEISEHLNKSREWVRQHLYGLGVYPEQRIGKTGRETDVYPSSSIYMLRTLILHFPPSNEWFALSEIKAMLSKTSEWVISRVEELGLESEYRLSPAANRPVAHYSKQTLDTLLSIVNDIPPAGEWLTVNKIAIKLGRTNDWVGARLDEFAGQAEVRLDDTSRRMVHYPPEVIEKLHELSENTLKEAGDWMTANGIAKAIGVDPIWVANRIQEYEHFSEIRLVKSGKGSMREAAHYPYEVYELLRESRPVEIGDWATVGMIVKATGRSYKWVQTRAKEYSDTSESRIAENGQVLTCYPPAVYQLICERAQKPGRGL